MVKSMRFAQHCARWKDVAASSDALNNNGKQFVMALTNPLPLRQTCIVRRST
ncbi:MAG: hypothetical protein LKF99_01535 [Bifidobacterium sp.]|nr:hypothetical protein [Bifidobacterium sp.]